MEIFKFFTDNILVFYLVIFAIYLGFELVSKVPSILHTPLMSGSNAISGIVIVGAILLIRKSPPDAYINLIIGSGGLVFAMINVVGGYVVTHRMLEMFKKKKK